VAYAYSPALRGRTYNCTLCRNAFAVGTEHSTAALTGLESPAIATLVPPSLPIVVARPKRFRGATSTRQNPLAIVPRPERSSGTAALFGLIACFLIGFSMIATGIGYLLWPVSATDQIPSAPTTALPTELPTDVEKPKNLNEILKEPPPVGTGKQFSNPPIQGPFPGEPLVPLIKKGPRK